MWISIPKFRIHALRHSIKSALGKGIVAARGLAHIAGKCVSMAKAILPAKLMLRNVDHLLKQRQSWQDILLLNTSTITDLSCWSRALSSWNGCAIHSSTIQAQLINDGRKLHRLGRGGRLPGGARPTEYPPLQRVFEPSRNDGCAAVRPGFRAPS